MNLTRFFGIVAVLLLSSCKKDATDNPDGDTPAVDANGNIVVSSDADGACYSILSKVYTTNSGTSSLDINYAYAWFGKVNAFKDAGTVSVNGFDLTNIGGVNTYTFVGFQDLYTSNAAEWVVAGNATSGVPGFTHTDNTPFPAGGEFTLPATVNLNQSLTINFSPINNVAGIVYGIRGNKGQKNKAIATGGSSVSFTSAELNEVAFPNDGIAVIVMPVVIVPQTLNGKKIYFVKQLQHARETLTL